MISRFCKEARHRHKCDNAGKEMLKCGQTFRFLRVVRAARCGELRCGSVLHPRFGDRITVERNLKRHGASSYVLLDARGRKAALDRGEKPKDVLDRMLDHFTVDANNPLTIITQDKSRSLLNGKPICSMQVQNSNYGTKKRASWFFCMLVKGSLCPLPCPKCGCS
jgi:hypothetical protein